MYVWMLLKRQKVLYMYMYAICEFAQSENFPTTSKLPLEQTITVIIIRIIRML